jgi:type IV pilus assembly protein PilM
MRYAAGKTVVGLDIQPGYVAAVESRAGQVAVERAAIMPLAPGVVREGEVVDGDTLGSSLRELFAQHKLSKHIRLGVANPRIVMRMLDLPPIREKKEIESAVQFQAQEHIPMPLDQAVLEHQPLGVVETGDGPRTRVVLVAARREMISRLLDATRKAGLRLQGIDLSAFAMIRALHRQGSTEPTLYISVGGITNLAVAAGTTCLFTRVVSHGTEVMAEQLAERRGLTMEHAHMWLKYVGLLTPVEDVEGEEAIVLEARNVLSEGVAGIADDVRNSLDFHAMQGAGTPVERAVLTGPAVAIPGFCEQLGGEIGLPLEVGTVEESRPGGFAGVEPGQLSVAAGLTVEEAAT